MPSLKDIRLRIASIRNTQQTTRAMKMVSAAKLRKAQDSILKLRPYANKLGDLLNNLTAGLEDGATVSPLAQPRDVKQVLLVVITSNKGLCGAFNTAIIRLAQNTIASDYAQELKEGRLKMICVGRKGHEFFSRRGYPVLGVNCDLFSRLSFQQVNEVGQDLLDGYLDGRWDKVEIFYNEFKNAASQIRTRAALLPLNLSQSGAQASDYIYEPGKVELLRELIPNILKMQFYKAVLDSNASEHGARMVAMDNATENAQELLENLKLSYNKARQAAITKEILEIVGGAEALGA